MKQLTDQLLDLGFHETSADGKSKVAKADASSEWSHVQAKEGKTTVFQKGAKKVEFKHVQTGSVGQRHITFKDGDREILFTNTGDLPSEEFVKTFAEEKTAPAEEKKK